MDRVTKSEELMADGVWPMARTWELMVNGLWHKQRKKENVNESLLVL
jgi:hypothetical protein